MVIAIPVLCAAIGFIIGRYTSTSEPFYFIGTPVDLAARDDSAGNRAFGNAPILRLEQSGVSPDAAGTTCGAQTKAGKPCRRKVKGGGYCWQHRKAPTTPQ